MGRWIVARSHPSREAWAAEQCTRQGFSVFLPRILELNGHGARRAALAKALFPSYLFIEIEQRWRPLLSTFGIRSVVMRGEAPDIVPLGVIEQLRRRQDPDGFIELPKRQRGDRIRIRRGPFAGHQGLVAGMSAHERVRVLLGVLGGQTTVIVAERDVVDAA
jgi:transcriptional antiterminator RfaH